MWSSTFLDENGRPSFNALQNYGSASSPPALHFFIFDLLVLQVAMSWEIN
jgi:ATP-dependent DNA ligase